MDINYSLNVFGGNFCTPLKYVRKSLYSNFESCECWISAS